MSRFFIAVSIPVLFAAIGPAAPVPRTAATEPVTFFPTRVGDRMVHAIGDTDYVTVVTEVQEIDGGRRVTVCFALPGGQTSHQMTVEVSPKGLLQTASYGRLLDEPYWDLKLAPAADGTWTGKWPMFDNGDPAFRENEHTAAGWETVEVPAGKFRAIRVERNGTFRGFKDRTTLWYSPGLGCVKWSDGITESVLKSFTPGK